jgi:hypothetical protein
VKLTCSKPLESVKVQLTLKAMELGLFEVPTKTATMSQAQQFVQTQLWQKVRTWA